SCSESRLSAPSRKVDPQRITAQGPGRGPDQDESFIPKGYRKPFNETMLVEG
ncbi:hypothetical protein BG015_000905, partial [Linnemannia schmuckeri]